MKIGLVGSPGSGKSALAQSLKTALESLDDDRFTPIKIIDGYVEELRDEIDLALGWHGTYIGNAHVALKREALERLAAQKAKTVITCGTMYETSSYTGQYMQEEYELLTDDDDYARYDLIVRVEAITRFFASLYVDTIYYDHIFYLPPVTEITDPRVKELEKNLQAAFDGFKLYPITKLFVEGDDLLKITENRLKIVLEEVLNADNSKEQNVQVKESDGSGVRSGGKDGKEQATA